MDRPAPPPTVPPLPTKPIKLSKDKAVRESVVEDANRKDAKKVDCLFEKFTTPNKRSVPDRMLTFKLGLIVFIEYKAPGKRASDDQFRDHQKRRARRCLVYVVDDKAKGRELINRLAELDHLDYEFYRAELEANKLKYTDKSVVE